jgi:energy-coupling factor transport system ATP-binding protein
VRTALAGISLDIDAGDWLAVVGQGGSGKSTLLKVLSGLLPVSKGSVSGGLKESGRVGIVLQNPGAQIVGETVSEDLVFGMETAAVDPDVMPQRAEWALAEAGLAGMGDRAVNTLSGGQLQLLAMAGCLSAGARALVLDEATSMLDSQSARMVIQAVKRLHRQGMTVVWATHRLEELAWAERVLALEHGMPRFEGKPGAFFYGEPGGKSAGNACERLGFAAPYAVQAAKELQSAGFSLPTLPITAEELDDALQAMQI